jgi:tryptophan synthase alpha chain
VTTRIGRAFTRAATERRAALVVFVEAGDPDLGVTERLLPALAEAGADVIELGIPFSDPIADGPVIQRASERALLAGTTLARTLDLLAHLRRGGLEAAVVLFGYANPVLAMGEEDFARRARAAGADGVLLTDLPAEEAAGFLRLLRKEGLDLVFLVAPTSPDERLRKAGALSRGFLYLVSRTGVTGARPELAEGLDELVRRVKIQAPRPPLAVGFGISTADQAAIVARLADGVVVGSALVSAMENAVREGLDPVAAAAGRVRDLAAAVRRA